MEGVTGHRDGSVLNNDLERPSSCSPTPAVRARSSSSQSVAVRRGSARSFRPWRRTLAPVPSPGCSRGVIADYRHIGASSVALGLRGVIARADYRHISVSCLVNHPESRRDCRIHSGIQNLSLYYFLVYTMWAGERMWPGPGGWRGAPRSRAMRQRAARCLLLPYGRLRAYNTRYCLSIFGNTRPLPCLTQQHYTCSSKGASATLTCISAATRVASQLLPARAANICL